MSIISRNHLFTFSVQSAPSLLANFSFDAHPPFDSFHGIRYLVHGENTLRREGRFWPARGSGSGQMDTTSVGPTSFGKETVGQSSKGSKG